ncbi:hypothetical protein D3C71_1282180 [compost metagenome]
MLAHFLIDAVSLEKDDFSFGLKNAVDYQNWLHPGSHTMVTCTELPLTTPNNTIPVGSIEFVEKFLQAYHGKALLKPLNIPDELFTWEFLKRYVVLTDKNEFVFLKKEYFIKSAEKHKVFADIVNEYSYEKVPEGKLLISELIDIDSEWRVFVFDGEIAGVSNYAGDPWLLPDKHLVEKAIQVYQNNPQAYTLDVGVNRKGSFIIEAHVFFSCGLYGFGNYGILPQMFIRGFKHLLNGSCKR